MKILIKYYLLYVFFISIFVITKLILNHFLNDYFQIRYYGDYFTEISYKIIILFVYVNLISPIVEEVCFRLPLLNNKFIVGISDLIYFSFYCISDLVKREGEYFYFLLFVGFFYYFLLIFIKNKQLLIVISGLFFGLLHLMNFPEINFGNILPHLFNLMPHLFFGMLAAKLRIEEGFKYTVFFHIISNTIVSFFQILVNVSF